MTVNEPGTPAPCGLGKPPISNTTGLFVSANEPGDDCAPCNEAMTVSLPAKLLARNVNDTLPLASVTASALAA